MGNSPKKKIARSDCLNITENWQGKNVLQCLLSNYRDLVNVDCVYLDNKKYFISILTKDKIIFGIFIKRKKQKKLDIRCITEIYDADGKNIIIHHKRKNIIAIQFDTHINIYQINIVEKSHKLLNLLQFGLNHLHFISQNMYFTHENQIIYTSLDGNIFIYDFIQKKLINKIDLSMINRLQQINGIHYGFDINTNKCFAVFAKRTYPKDIPIDTELIYILNITKYFKKTVSPREENQNTILKKQLLYFNSNKLLFELCFNDNRKKESIIGLKLFKQIECLSFSPNMEFLAVVCGSSIDFFNYHTCVCNNNKQYEFRYIKYHNYGVVIKHICWIDNNILVVSNKKSSSLVITQIKPVTNINKYYCIINDIVEELTNEIIDVICGYLQEWKMDHYSIKTNCDALKQKNSVIKILMTCL